MGRRLNGEGCVYKSGNRYIARYQDGWRDNGKPKIRSFSATSKRAAIIRMREFQRRQTELGEHTIADDLLSDAMQDWLENRKKLELKPTSYERLCSTIRNHIDPRIGCYPIGELNATIVQTELINMAPPPMLFEDLLCYLDGDVLCEVRKLLELKRSTCEVGEGRRIDCINEYIERKIEEADEYIATIKPDKKNDWDGLNKLFLSMVLE